MNENIIDLIKKDYLHFSDTYKIIADVIIKHPEDKFNLTIAELAKQAYCAQSTIIKFINYLGYKSYPVFKHELNDTSNTYANNIVDSFYLVDNYFADNPDTIDLLIKKINKANKVYFFASGMSRMGALDFCLKANKLKNNKFIFELEASVQSTLIKTVNHDDLVIFVSNSGNCKELIQFRKSIDNDIILITNRNNSKLSKMCESVINLNNSYEMQQDFKEFSKDSKYSIIYFFDLIFDKIRDESINE